MRCATIEWTSPDRGICNHRLTFSVVRPAFATGSRALAQPCSRSSRSRQLSATVLRWSLCRDGGCLRMMMEVSVQLRWTRYGVDHCLARPRRALVISSLVPFSAANFTTTSSILHAEINLGVVLSKSHWWLDGICHFFPLSRLCTVRLFWDCGNGVRIHLLETSTDRVTMSGGTGEPKLCSRKEKKPAFLADLIL